jgi:hypothetical protein
MVITGPRALTDAVMRRTAALREMQGDVEAGVVREQQQFVSDNAVLLRQLRVLADVLRDEARRVKELQGLEKTQSTVVKAQSDAVSDRQAELREALKTTKELYESVKAKSAELLKNRQAIQQKVRDTEAGEEHVRYLEKLADALSSEKK